MKKPAQGMFIVEFAIIAVVMFTLLFGIIELARIIYIWNTANLATQRGARVAAVCPIDHPAVFNATVFAAPTAGLPSDSPILRGLTTNHVSVDYLDENEGDQGGNPVFEDTRYVRVYLNKDGNYKVKPLIPFINTEITLPIFETTIPSESLGLKPDPDNPSTVLCTCYGTPKSCNP